MMRGLTVLNRYADRLAVGCLLAIGYLSLTPLAELPEIPGNDKFHHLVAYAMLAFLATLPRRTATALVAALLAVIAYGGLIEVLQPYVNRYGEFNDFLANAAGAILGGLLAHGVMRRFRGSRIR